MSLPISGREPSAEHAEHLLDGDDDRAQKQMERDLRGRADANRPSAVRFEQMAEEALRGAAVLVDLPLEFAHGPRPGGPAGIRVDDGYGAEFRARRADGFRVA